MAIETLPPPQTPFATSRADPALPTPRTATAARIREVWDMRLRESEREMVLQVAALPVEFAARQWSSLTAEVQLRIMIALRDLQQLGNEAAYALGYSRRNG